MGIIAKLAAPAQAKATSTTFQATDHELVSKAFGASSYAGKTVSEISAAGVSTHWACIRIIAETVASLPWAVYRKEKSGNAVKDNSHPVHEVLMVAPNADQTAVEFRETMLYYLAGTGNAYGFVDRSGDRLSALTPIENERITPMRKQNNNTRLTIREGEAFFRITERGKAEDFPRSKVWHLKLFGRDPLRGLSIIGAARQALGGAMGMEEFAYRLFGQGGVPSGTVSVTQVLTQDQRELAKEKLQQIAGLSESHKFVLLEGGMKLEPWGVTNLEELQFIMARRFGVYEICRFHNMPPHRVFEFEKGASYASIEQMGLEFVIYTLMPYLVKMESSVQRWLMSPKDRSEEFFTRFTVDALLRASTGERYAAFSQGAQNGWLSRNEIRALENLNRVEGLDGYTAQTNLASVDAILAGAIEKAIAPLRSKLDRI